jgi:hypothetical protein
MENRRKDGNPSVISHEGDLQQGLVRACEKASSGETHYFVDLVHLLYDRVLLNRCPTNL